MLVKRPRSRQATITTIVESAARSWSASWLSAAHQRARWRRYGCCGTDWPWWEIGRWWQARRDSNPQPTVLETATLPIELHACGYDTISFRRHSRDPERSPGSVGRKRLTDAYSMISVTRPAPMVRPPSRMAKLLGLFHGDRHDELDVDGDVVAGHDHLHALRQVDDAGHVRGAEVELGTVTVEERRVAATLVLGEDVDLGLGLLVRGDGLRGGETWPRSMPSFSMPRSRMPTLSPAWPWSSSLRNISMPVTTVVVGVLEADDLDVVVDLDDAALDTTGGDGAAAGDREDVFDGHQEGLVDLAGARDVGVDGVHEIGDGWRLAFGLAFEGGGGGAADDRALSPSGTW
jgi:hypothetical protein